MEIILLESRRIVSSFFVFPEMRTAAVSTHNAFISILSHTCVLRVSCSRS